MDFRGRGAQTPQVQPANSGSSNFVGGGANQLKNLKSKPVGRLLQIGGVVLLFAATALLVALTFLLAFGGNSQARSIIEDKYQAVFLNNGQVYFGKIDGFADNTIKFQKIYYLQTNNTGTDAAAQTAASNNVSLVKLGCELHGPYDEMIINNDQVLFWENLQDNSQVVKAIAEYQKQNPKATCTDQAQSSSTQQAAPTTTPAPATTTPTTTLPAPATTPTTRRP